MGWRKELVEAEYWRLNKRKGAVYTIEYTFYGTGWVRAKLDSLANWEYSVCKEAKYALSIGEQMVNAQIKRREFK